MNPNGLAPAFVAHNAVMAAVQQCSRSARSSRETTPMSSRFAPPAHGEVVARRYSAAANDSAPRPRRNAGPYVRAGWIRQPARAAVNEHDQLLLPRSGALKARGPAPARPPATRRSGCRPEGAQRPVNSVDSRSWSPESRRPPRPRMFQVEPESGPAIQPGVAPDQVRLEQRHAAPDVAANEVRIDEASVTIARPRANRGPDANPETGASRTPSSLAVA